LSGILLNGQSRTRSITRIAPPVSRLNKNGILTQGKGKVAPQRCRFTLPDLGSFDIQWRKPRLIDSNRDKGFRQPAMQESSPSLKKVSDVNVIDTLVLPAPEYLCRKVVTTDKQDAFVADARQQIHEIIFGDDNRLIVIVGPCSIHDVEAGRDYARRLADLSANVSDRMLLVMRSYFEKPRTTVGWKGLIMDPGLDGSYNIPSGLKIARRFLLDVIDAGVPTATELLDPISPQFIADLICWSAIGARTAESQTHRQMASGLSMPLGIKNATSGNILVAVNAIRAAMQPQTFLGVSKQGLASAVTTRGNANCHIVLRGGDDGPNGDPEHIEQVEELLLKHALQPSIMVDCSHANSGKDPTRQPEVFRSIIKQVGEGRRSIIGAMLESNLVAGNQPFPQPKSDLTYGQSITDACIGWETTERLILEAHEALEGRFAGQSSFRL